MSAEQAAVIRQAHLDVREIVITDGRH